MNGQMYECARRVGGINGMGNRREFIYECMVAVSIFSKKEVSSKTVIKRKKTLPIDTY